ncbi:unnamed protein product, partial [Ectocarpus sp. 8 AP-2014]
TVPILPRTLCCCGAVVKYWIGILAEYIVSTKLFPGSCFKMHCCLNFFVWCCSFVITPFFSSFFPLAVVCFLCACVSFIQIFVGGLDQEVNDADFRGYFAKFGKVEDAVVMYDKKTGRSRGFGFITYDSPDIVRKVMSGGTHELKGKSVEVKTAAPRDGPRQFNGGGGFNGGGY